MLCRSNWRCATHCAAHCGAPRIVAHRTYMGSCGEKNDWQFSNPRIDTIVAHRTYMGSCGEKNDWQFSNPRIDTIP